MRDDRRSDIRNWIVQAGLTGMSENDILDGFCSRMQAGHVPVRRATAVIDTLHPIHEGRVFRWLADGAEPLEAVELDRSAPDDGSWERSPFSYLQRRGETMLRRRLTGTEPDDFTIMPDLRAQGQTDYLVLFQDFTPAGSIGEMDCVHASWTTNAPGGFEEADIAALTDLFPALALALKCASLHRIAGTLVETYLGRDAGRRVLAGGIERGVADRVRAVIWFSDLRGFTRITDTAEPEHIIPFLNEYAEAIISSIHEAGGDVLKLIGDGTLAIFTAADEATACRCALSALSIMRTRIAELNSARQSAGLFVTDAYVGLHLGEVFYGNVGASDRLDFTVIGPAVNMASRISVMCRSVERDVLMSQDFVRGLAEIPEAVVSVGRYALRGFDRPQELFTAAGLPQSAGVQPG